MEISALQKARYEYAPKLPGMLRHGIADICVKEGEETQSVADQEKIKALFPNTYGKKEITFQKGANTSVAKKQVVGVILSGGQAPGGHNVICGLYDALKATNPENVLYGFKNGPSGLIEDDYLVFDDEYINAYRNTGGFDIIGSGRTKLETQEQFAIAAEVCKKHGITAIVIIGGDDSNTNAAVLAEYFAANNTGVQVIGCPKTIDGDLKNEDIECSFGFDTAAKTYSEVIGNIERDANSAKKYWHFIKVMGRSASHVALECALETQPNICLISEEVAAKKMSLSQIADYIADSVAKRAAKGMNFGVAIIPEGVVEFVPESGSLAAVHPFRSNASPSICGTPAPPITQASSRTTSRLLTAHLTPFFRRFRPGRSQIGSAQLGFPLRSPTPPGLMYATTCSMLRYMKTHRQEKKTLRAAVLSMFPICPIRLLPFPMLPV